MSALCLAARFSPIGRTWTISTQRTLLVSLPKRNRVITPEHELSRAKIQHHRPPSSLIPRLKASAALDPSRKSFHDSQTPCHLLQQETIIKLFPPSSLPNFAGKSLLAFFRVDWLIRLHYFHPSSLKPHCPCFMFRLSIFRFFISLNFIRLEGRRTCIASTH